MSQYILIFVWLGTMALICQQSISVYKSEFILGKREYRLKFGVAFMIFLPVILMAGFRESIADTGAYVAGFQSLSVSLGELPSYLGTISKDKGFAVLNVLLKCIFHDNSTAYLLTLAAIQGISLVEIFRKYSSKYILSIFLFLASTDYMSWMFNGIRQFTAVTIVFATTALMIRKKYAPLIVVILLASTIHGTALLMIPVVFIAQGKAWNKKTILFICAALLAIVYVDQFTEILDTLLSDTQYTNVVSDWKFSNDDGTNALRVLVYSIPAILSFVGRRWIDREGDPVINLCTNMSIISAGLYLVSMVTSGIFIGRLPIYVSLYSYILLPWEIDHFFKGKSVRIMNALVILCYLVFYYYQMVIAWGTELF